MKKQIAFKDLGRPLTFLGMIFFIVLLVSCGDDDSVSIIPSDDDDVEDPSTTFAVSPGLYIANVDGDTTITLGMGLKPTLTNGAAFGETVNRSGYLTVMTYLNAGNYMFAEINTDQKINSVTGGALQVVDSANTALGGYDQITLEPDGASFSVASNGVYHVVYDQITATGLLVKVEKMGINGDATEGGWGVFVDLQEKSASAADGAVWEVTDVVLRNGAVQPRINGSDDLILQDNFFVFSFYGGPELSDLFVGGSPITWAEEGVYTVNVALSVEGSLSMDFTRTGDAPEITFDPANFAWGTIGPAANGDWNATDIDITYIDWAGNWTMLQYFDQGEFAIRANDEWNEVLNTSNVNLTSTTITEVSGENPNFAVADAGMYFIKVSTSDEGATWDVTIDPANPGLIGPAVPNGWDGPDHDLTFDGETGGVISWSIADFAFASEDFAIRFNDQWEVPLAFAGVMVDGSASGSLIESNTNFKFDPEGSYSLTLATADKGTSWTLTVE